MSKQVVIIDGSDALDTLSRVVIICNMRPFGASSVYLHRKRRIREVKI